MFITFEGGEGSGKTTQFRLLTESLLAKEFDVVSTREPGGTPLGEHVRHCLLSPSLGFSFGHRAELMLFLASRVELIEEVIVPSLAKDAIVLCDRFNDSTIAYQGGGRELGLEYVQKLCNLACNNFKPHLTFLLDIDPDEGFRRIRRAQDRLEAQGEAFHKRVRKAFLELASQEKERIIVLDASLPKKVLSSMIMDAVEDFLKNQY